MWSKKSETYGYLLRFSLIVDSYYIGLYEWIYHTADGEQHWYKWSDKDWNCFKKGMKKAGILHYGDGETKLIWKE